MFTQDELIRAVARAAEPWRDPDYLPRAEAVEATLRAENSLTEESIAFAVNRQMHVLDEEALRAWIRGRSARQPSTVGVLTDVQVPFRELHEFLAVVLTGHRYVGYLSSFSPYLLPAFAEEVARHTDELEAAFHEQKELLNGCDAAIVTGDADTLSTADERCEAHGIAPERRLFRSERFGIAILDGQETREDLEHLSEDVLLHDGHGCRRVAVVWAPRGDQPDLLLDVMAEFRSIFPASRSLPGTLKMQQAFLQALKQPHAYGEGMEFLLSKGDPEPQPPGHVRWSEYDTLEDVARWLSQHREHLELIVARPETIMHLGEGIPSTTFGEAHRPPLDWKPAGIDTVDFLCAL